MVSYLIKALVLIGSVVLATALAGSQPVASPLPETQSLKIDATHSFVHFSIQHMGVGRAYGRFNAINGELVLDGENSSIQITIPADSIDTGNEKRDRHLRSPDFFNAAQFPEITFRSTKVKSSGQNSFQVEGTLALHGVKKTVMAEADLGGAAKDQRGRYRAGLEARFTLKRSDFGMNHYLKEGMLGDEVKVSLAIEAVKR